MKNTENAATFSPEPLSDDKLDAVAGGVDSRIVGAWRSKAEQEGRGTHIGCHDDTPFVQIWRNADCPKCGGAECLFGSGTRPEHFSGGRVVGYECTDVRCYICKYDFNTCELKAAVGKVYIQNWGR